MTANGFLHARACLSLTVALCACAVPGPAPVPVRVSPATRPLQRDPNPSPSPSRPPPEIVPVVHLPPPPTDQVIKVRGRRILLKRGRMISDLNRPPYRPRVAERWRKQGNVHQGIYKVCVTSEGAVSEVSTLKSPGPRALDGSFREAIGYWRYQPTRLGNKRVPFCYRLGIRVTYATAQPCGSDTADSSAGCVSTDTAGYAPGRPAPGPRPADVHVGG
jgi:hypothetical protein